jgi:hypothetical protein
MGNCNSLLQNNKQNFNAIPAKMSKKKKKIQNTINSIIFQRLRGLTLARIIQ